MGSRSGSAEPFACQETQHETKPAITTTIAVAVVVVAIALNGGLVLES